MSLTEKILDEKELYGGSCHFPVGFITMFVILAPVCVSEWVLCCVGVHVLTQATTHEWSAEEKLWGVVLSTL